MNAGIHDVSELDWVSMDTVNAQMIKKHPQARLNLSIVIPQKVNFTSIIRDPYLEEFGQLAQNLIKAKSVKLYYIGNENDSQCGFFVQKVITFISDLSNI